MDSKQYLIMHPHYVSSNEKRTGSAVGKTGQDIK
jgi:hypothetical protein